ncbi:ribonuclease E inhibitor RraB [Colwellia echini]|uniref:Ribonuclease E inhibitor RraB n=1 Tax=Colwellia echini TaxID=1982103 RepID=A0ABY3MZ72_9GAMM|nr:ribonuclease E inhibitor RraB [Colwellia echini]TYK66384.1 ribonuclease E inhibitor RraB [Colwellia echini]
MSRDLTLFPEDEIGDTLWQMQETGEDLAIEREIEFSVLFSSKDLALEFGQILLENNQKLSFTPFEGDELLTWEVTAYPFMLPSYENIVSYQELLVASGEPLQAQFNGVFFIG